jgi:hypothetical protein
LEIRSSSFNAFRHTSDVTFEEDDFPAGDGDDAGQ